MENGRRWSGTDENRLVLCNFWQNRNLRYGATYRKAQISCTYGNGAVVLLALTLINVPLPYRRAIFGVKFRHHITFLK